jgi:secondary thiamine-phosphate synthase enzyme
MTGSRVIEVETTRRTEFVDFTDRVRSAVEPAFDRLVDERRELQHTSEGDRNPWSHVRAVLTASSVTIPLLDGELALGDHPRIFVFEFDGPRTRRVVVTSHA